MNHFVVLVGGQIDQYSGFLSGQLFVQLFSNQVAPKLVQVLATSVGKAGTHLEAVGLHQIKRAQQTVEARENPQVLLGKGQLFVVECFCRKARVDIALEGQHCLFGVILTKGEGPGLKARRIELGQLVADAHQAAYLCRTQLA